MTQYVPQHCGLQPSQQHNVEFDTLLCFVLINNFLQPLPALILLFSNKRTHTGLTKDAEGGGRKKQKKQETRLAGNPQVDPGWKLCPGEKWGDVFAGHCLEY